MATLAKSGSTDAYSPSHLALTNHTLSNIIRFCLVFMMPPYCTSGQKGRNLMIIMN